MSSRAVATPLLAAVIGASLVGAAWWRSDVDLAPARRTAERRLALLESENARLRGVVEEAERAKKLAANKAQRDAIEKSVAEIRGLPFKTPVDYNVLSRSEIKAVVSGKLDEVFSPAEFEQMSGAFARLGVLPEGYPLRQKYIELLGEQIAAFYDQHQHKLFMFEDASLENSQNRVILAHELTHALQDQYFGLGKLPLEIKNNDDRALAASALVEGEATLVMSEYMLKNMSLAALKDTMSASLTQNMEQIQKAPRFLRESLVFPYLRGQEFCAAVLAQGGYDAISKVYARPASSSSQILHPSKFLADVREEPLEVTWTETKVNGVAPEIDNVLGEFGTRVLLAETIGDSAAEEAAAGWRGDRYLSFNKGEALVWKTLWATPEDASQFYAAEKQALENRYKPAGANGSAADFKADGPRGLRLQVNGSAVLLVDAPTGERAEQLASQFAGESLASAPVVPSVK